MLFAKSVRYIRTGTGKIPVEIRLYQPVEHQGGWRCPIEIEWPERTRVLSAYGLDALQAIDLAMEVIGINLYTSRYHAEGLLYAEGMKGGYGFPVAKGMRDILVGDDIAMFG